MSPTFVIKDWAGNHLFQEYKFESFDAGWAFLYEKLPDADDEALAEYHVVQTEGAAPTYEEYLETLFGGCSVSETYDGSGIQVEFKIEKKQWDVLKKKGDLGSLYNCDLSNYLSRKGLLKFFAIPIVGDRDRAKNGIKTIRVEFRKGFTE